MKLLLIFSLITFISCERNTENDFYWGECSALKNNLNWSANIRAPRNTFNKDFIDLVFDRFNEKGFHREHLGFIRIPQILGNNELLYSGFSIQDSLRVTYGTSVDDGDVNGDRYKLITSDSILDFINITKIDGDQIYGEFEVSLEKDTITYKEQDFSAPFIVVIRNGKFHTRISP